MLLTVSKRLEFSASRRLFVKEWSDAENLAAFGAETSARYGTGRNYVAYIPNGKVIGLSKVARIVDMFARRLQIQENLTIQIADALMKTLHPVGVAVVIEAKHLCMMMRGVEKQNSVMKTSCLLGSFKEDARTRSEFLALLA